MLPQIAIIIFFLCGFSDKFDSLAPTSEFLKRTSMNENNCDDCDHDETEKRLTKIINNANFHPSNLIGVHALQRVCEFNIYAVTITGESLEAMFEKLRSYPQATIKNEIKIARKYCETQRKHVDPPRENRNDRIFANCCSHKTARVQNVLDLLKKFESEISRNKS
eukprot:NODE_737_length_4335_cov_0.521719.p2 type:complete len:165 gc:universal NODE_737_length_4335_cov_0.521719:3910-3416(-)